MATLSDIEYHHRYYLANRTRLRLRQKTYSAEHSADAVERTKRWRERNPGKRNVVERAAYAVNKKRRLAYLRRWITENPEKRRRYRNKWSRAKRLACPTFRLRDCLSRRLRHALKGNAKSASTLRLIGCGLGYLKQHIEQQFTPGMAWENWGKGQGHWNIDHIVPCAFFDLKLDSQQRLCFNFSNLQPLWEEDNIKKGAKV